MKTVVKRFLLMLQFLTAIPVPKEIEADDRDLGEGLVFAVPVGLLIGGILAAFHYLFSLIFPPLVVAIMLNIVYIKITGGLHLDGLADTFDGVLSHRPRENMLEIMKDSRIGTHGVLALICILLLNTAFYFEADYLVTRDVLRAMIVLMPVIGRTGMIISAGISEYARSEGGLGKPFINFCGTKEIVIGVIMCSVVIICFRNIQITAAGVAALIFPFGAAGYFNKKLQGLTGDVLGAICEMTQTFFLFMVFALNGGMGLWN
ncbi:MAG: adenosylcobinamide-GDP ribazoletransferase [Firmicutes bacterium]|nr:adenosylcobinamide-GDP ribazoletransferase [Bacillota bacterium]